MKAEEYRELLAKVKDAQGKLNQAVFNDLQRLETAESLNTKKLVEASYQKGISDAWEFAGDLMYYDESDLNEIFGTRNIFYLFEKIGYEKAKEIFREYKKQEEEAELHVGDEVYDSIHTFAITRFSNDGETITGFTENGSFYVTTCRKELKKTGRHFDQIEQLFDSMRARKDLEL